jgi:hypothetical protein
MTTKELIEKLSKFPDRAEVYVSLPDDELNPPHWREIEEVGDPVEEGIDNVDVVNIFAGKVVLY